MFRRTSAIFFLAFVLLAVQGFNYPENWEDFHKWGDDTIAGALGNSPADIAAEFEKNTAWFDSNKKQLASRYGYWKCFLIRRQTVVDHSDESLVPLMPSYYEQLGDVAACINPYHTYQAELEANTLLDGLENPLGGNGNFGPDDLLIHDPPEHTIGFEKKNIGDIPSFVTDYKYYSNRRLSATVYIRPTKNGKKVYGFVCVVDSGAPYAVSLIRKNMAKLDTLGFPTAGAYFAGYIGLRRVIISESTGNAYNANMCGIELLKHLIVEDRFDDDAVSRKPFRVQLRRSWIPDSATTLLANGKLWKDDTTEDTKSDL